MTASGDQICFFFIVNIQKIKIRITKQISTKVHWWNLYPRYVFSCFFVGSSMNHRPSDQPTTDPYPPTHKPTTIERTTRWVIFERSSNGNIFILQNTNAAWKTYNYTSVYYLKNLLVSIEHIGESIIFIFLVFKLKILFYYSPDISKLLSRYGFFFFFQYKMSIK